MALKGIEKALTTGDLIQSNRDIEVPFRIRVLTPERELDLRCSQILRLLPGRRMVVLAQHGDLPVVAKIFLGAAGLRDYAREKRGIQALVRANVTSPELLADGDVPLDGKVLIFSCLSDSRSLLDVWAEPLIEDKRKQILRQVLGSIASMHNAGVVQQDIHLENFLYESEKIYLIDGGGVIQKRFGRSISKRQGLKNLGLFFAQLVPKYDYLIGSVLPAYQNARGFEQKIDMVQRLAAQTRVQRHRRKRRYLKKIFRECSQVICHSDFHNFLLCERKFWSNELEKLLADPDPYMLRGRLLKDGNSATVSEISVDSQLLVVKRYNFRNIVQAARRSLRSSRARKSWYNAHLMEFLGIPTATPVAILEKRWGPLCLSAYFIAECAQGTDARAYFRQDEVSDQDLHGLVQILVDLEANFLAHGDLKDTNFLMSYGGPVLIDLDSMREYRNATSFRNEQQKDRRRFMQNWEDRPDLQERIRGIIGKTAADPD